MCLLRLLLDLRGPDTPFPQEKFSDGTLDLLNKTKEKLSQEPLNEHRPCIQIKDV